MTTESDTYEGLTFTVQQSVDGLGGELCAPWVHARSVNFGEAYAIWKKNPQSQLICDQSNRSLENIGTYGEDWAWMSASGRPYEGPRPNR
jgi:hypothetical protein